MNGILFVGGTVVIYLLTSWAALAIADAMELDRF